MSGVTSAAELRAMARSCRQYAASWPAEAGREALLATARELDQLASAAAERDERAFQRIWRAPASG
jgi:hypothetical protein